MGESRIGRFQSPHGDSFFSDASPQQAEHIYVDHHTYLFQSPHGDSFFSDGIQSMSTTMIWEKQFQSPHGDSFFSDKVKRSSLRTLVQILFQSPHGDSFFSDKTETGDHTLQTRTVSIPSRGFVLF